MALLALAAVAMPACDTDGPGNTGYNHAGAVTSRAVVTVTSNRGSMALGDDRPATITVTVTNSATGQPAPDLTVISMTTNIGNFGSLGGPNAVLLETRGGSATVVFFAGDVLGTATIRAAALGAVGFVDIRIR